MITTHCAHFLESLAFTNQLTQIHTHICVYNTTSLKNAVFYLNFHLGYSYFKSNYAKQMKHKQKFQPVKEHCFFHSIFSFDLHEERKKKPKDENCCKSFYLAAVAARRHSSSSFISHRKTAQQAQSEEERRTKSSKIVSNSKKWREKISRANG